MNKVILMGRLVKDPETRWTQSAEPLAVTKFTLAVNKKFKREGEADADFIACSAFGKTAEFVEKYFKKGQLVSVVGRLQVRSWDDQNGQKHWSTEVVVDETYFAESKTAFESHKTTGDVSKPSFNIQPSEGFSPIESVEDDDLPF